MARSRQVDRLSYPVAILIAAVSAGDPSPLLAGSVPAATGPETVQNLTTTGDQVAPRVAVGSGGGGLTGGGGGSRQIAVWQSPGIDGNGTGIVARIFDEDGHPLTGEVQVNNTTAGNQTKPAVAVSPNGEFFVVVWEGPDGMGGRDIFLRPFSTLDATPLTPSDLVVNQTLPGDQRSPAVAFAQHLLVTWEGPNGMEGLDIFGRLFDASAATPGNEFSIIDGELAGDQTNADVAGMQENDGFLVAFESADNQGSGIFYRMVSGTTGLPTMVGGRVNTTETGDQEAPAVGSSDRFPDPGDLNRYVVAWHGPDSSGRGIFYQLYTDLGAGSGSELSANADPIDDDTAPTVAVDEGETGFVDFVIAWTRTSMSPLEGGAILIRGRRLPGSGSPFAERASSDTPEGGTGIPEFAISSTTAVHSRPAIADDSLGNLTAFWQSSGADGSGEAILARRFTVEVVFEDGFETGNTSAWSATVPPPVP